MARKRRGPAIVAFALLAAATVAAVALVPPLLDRHGDRFSQERCTVTLDSASATLTAEQANNAALITAMSIELGLPARAATIALATAIQESSLRNIDYGDRDSVGLFQQRPSQGWGTVEEIMNPYYSTFQFYDHLLRVDGWQDMEVTVAAQTVQRSAFPDAYAAHEGEARLWASALTGHGGVVTCALNDGGPGTVGAYVDRLRLDFGDTTAASVAVSPTDAQTLIVVAEDSTAQSALMNWSVATASETEAVRVEWCGDAWLRESGQWETVSAVNCIGTEYAATIQGE